MKPLVGERVVLRRVTIEDEDEFVALARESVDLHRGLIFAPTTAAEFAEYLAGFDGVNAIGFVVRLNTTNRLVGFVNIRNIVRGADRSGVLGYGGFSATAGHGYVTEAVRVAVRYAFDELGLQRLEALIQSPNTPSRRVVERTGFRPVAAAPQAICIAGEWLDHERWVILAGEAGKTFKNLENRICQPRR